MDKSISILSDLTHYMKYARFISEENRRETFEETVTRNKDMHIKKFPQIEKEIEEASAIAFQIKASDLPEEDKAQRLAQLRQDFLKEIAGLGVTQYIPEF